MWWVRLYTLGLAPAVRERRLGQVESDLWEHEHDRREDGVAPARIGFAMLERAMRGAAADLFWRIRVEGPQVDISISMQRLGGAALLMLVAAAALSLTVNGYDPSIDGFDGELRRMAEQTSWQVATYAIFQVLAGLGMLVGSVLLCLALRPYSPAVAVVAAVALAAAGVLALATSAFYLTFAELADEYVDSGPEHADVVRTVARAFLLVIDAIVPATWATLAAGVYGFAFITMRHGLVAKWLHMVAGAGVVDVLALFAVAPFWDELEWPLMGVGFPLLGLWLVGAGVTLVRGGSQGGDPAASRVGEGAAPGTA